MTSRPALRPRLGAAHALGVLTAAGLALGAAGLAAPEPSASPQDTQDGPREPAPRQRVAGIDSLRITTRVEFAAEGAVPHHYETAFCFPGRARLELRPEGGRASARVLRYRRGEALFGLGPGESESASIDGAERARELLGVEARLAAFLWPEAHEWEGTGALRTARLPGLGSLEAPLDAESGLPTRIVSRDPEGALIESVAVLERAPADRGRAWPRRLALEDRDGPVWTESVTRIERRLRWADDFFVPPDRRTRAATAIEGDRAVDLLAEVRRDVPFVAPPDSLAAALVAARGEQARAAREGLVLREGARLVLGPDLQPRAIRLVLAEEPREPPPGWSAHPPRGAWVALLDGVQDVVPARAGSLRRSAGRPADGPSELWLAALDEGPGGLRLILPDPQLD